MRVNEDAGACQSFDRARQRCKYADRTSLNIGNSLSRPFIFVLRAAILFPRFLIRIVGDGGLARLAVAAPIIVVMSRHQSTSTRLPNSPNARNVRRASICRPNSHLMYARLGVSDAAFSRRDAESMLTHHQVLLEFTLHRVAYTGGVKQPMISKCGCFLS